MKRTREEEGEGEGKGKGKEEQQQDPEQEKDAPAPMATSPALNPVPATETPSGTSHGRELTWGDAVDFVLSVRNAFDRPKYHEFLGVVRQIDSIGVSGIVDRMKVLLRGHPDLKRDFNMFLPEQFELSLSDDDDDQHD